MPVLQTIQNAGEVLALYDRSHSEWGVREVAERLQLAKSSAHDLLASLARIGVLSRTGEGRYRLGWRLVAMSDTLLETTELCREARPVMQELAEKYRETLHLAVLNDSRVVFLETIESKQPVRVELRSFGSRLYPHATAVGKVLLAYQPKEEVERIVQKEGLPGFTSNTITDAAELHRSLEKIRKQGYAYDLEELLPDLCGIGAPIFNYTGHVVAAICMTVPIYRFLRWQSEFRTATIRSAKAISERLGYYSS